MENQDEALRALEIAKNKLSSGDLEAAKRFANKSLALHRTKEAEDFISSLATSSSTHAHATSARQRHPTAAADTPPAASTSKPKQETKKREYTADQAATVKRIRSCHVTAYYEILAVEKTCEDAAIKKAYRKHSLSVHPDKNGAPGADEAFKMVSTAFQILSDPDKRAHFDRYGGNPDDRRSFAQPSFRRQASGFGGGDEISPEDLFNMFFGGPAGGFGSRGFSTFGGPNIQTFQFGGPGMRRRHAGGQQQQQGDNNTPAWLQMLPLLFLVGFSLLTQLPSLFTSAPPPDPSFSFEPTAIHVLHKATANLKADYYLNPSEFKHSHLYQSLLSSNPSKTSIISQIVLESKELDLKQVSIPRSMADFETKVENHLIHTLRIRCENENDIQFRKLQRASGVLGFIGRDEEALTKLREERQPSCDRLRKFGYRVQQHY